MKNWTSEDHRLDELYKGKANEEIVAIEAQRAALFKADQNIYERCDVMGEAWHRLVKIAANWLWERDEARTELAALRARNQTPAPVSLPTQRALEGFEQAGRGETA